MDAKERAEKIVSRLILSRCTDTPQFFVLVDEIAAQIDEACAEAVANYKAESFPDVIEVGETKWFERGFCAAREKAAKLCENSVNLKNIENPDIPLINCRLQALHDATVIRAMQPEVNSESPKDNGQGEGK